jgi:hypothetical protein
MLMMRMTSRGSGYTVRRNCIRPWGKGTMETMKIMRVTTMTSMMRSGKDDDDKEDELYR